MNQSIVSVAWLKSKLDDENLVILDGTLPNQLAKQVLAIQEIQIKKARFFDLKNKFSDTTNQFPSAFPSAFQFENEAQKLGINSNSIIVVYDANGIYSSPRVWWLFKSMGHQEVYVLDGGLPEWMKHDFPTETKLEKEYTKGNFKAKLNSDILRKFDDIVENVTTQEELVIDVRSEERFNGEVPEPRAGLRSGTIENSINLPYTKVLHKGKFQDKENLKQVFKSLENEERKLVFSCGLGITACIVYLASEMILANTKAVYDGSWTEWGEKVKA